MPLYRKLGRVRATLVPMLCALTLGSLVAISSAVAVGGLFGLPLALLASLGPKSVTTPIAMSLAKANGGIPALTAVFVVITGVFGAVDRDAADERAAHPRLGGARLRRRAGGARHRHGARLPGRPARRRPSPVSRSDSTAR